MAKFSSLNQNDINLVKKIEPGLSEDHIKEYFIKGPGDGIFIKKAGLYYKLNKKYGIETPRQIKTLTPSIEEYELYRKMQGIKDGAPFACFKATLKIKEDYFEDMGTAHLGNCYNKEYLIEMATTRSTLRCIRQATDCNFCSAEEIWDNPEITENNNFQGKLNCNTTMPANNNGNGHSTPLPASTKQKTFIYNLMNSLEIDKEKMFQIFLDCTKRKIKSTADLTLQEASKVIEYLKEQPAAQKTSPPDEIPFANEPPSMEGGPFVKLIPAGTLIPQPLSEKLQERQQQAKQSKPKQNQ